MDLLHANLCDENVLILFRIDIEALWFTKLDELLQVVQDDVDQGIGVLTTGCGQLPLHWGAVHLLLWSQSLANDLRQPRNVAHEGHWFDHHVAINLGTKSSCVQCCSPNIWPGENLLDRLQSPKP